MVNRGIENIGKIGILMGGISREREISLKSGNAVKAALENLNYAIAEIDFSHSDEMIEKIKKSDVDCIFNALHGSFGEDGQVQKILDALKIPYTGSGVNASRLAIDKTVSHKIFKANGLVVPDYRIPSQYDKIDDQFYSAFPLVVKPAREGSSIGLFIVENLDSLDWAINEAAKIDNKLIVEKYIKGRELTVGILDEQALPVIEVIPKNKFYDFEAKYTQGMTEYIIPANIGRTLTEKIQNVALTAHKLIGCSCFSRVDIILNEDNVPVVLEINTIPGLTATSLLPKAAAFAGINFSQLCLKMIDSAMLKYKDKILT
ncbi:MAG: D-alanine--D-alanine ligase [Candidatus Omnitrophota bacterium]